MNRQVTICLPKCHLSFEVRTQLWAEFAFFIFQSGLTITWLARVCCTIERNCRLQSCKYFLNYPIIKANDVSDALTQTRVRSPCRRKAESIGHPCLKEGVPVPVWTGAPWHLPSHITFPLVVTDLEASQLHFHCCVFLNWLHFDRLLRIGRGNWSSRWKPTPVPLCPSKMSHDQTWDRILVFMWCSRLSRHLVWYLVTNVSEEHTGFCFRAEVHIPSKWWHPHALLLTIGVLAWTFKA
jgi:hypothetical protein